MSPNKHFKPRRMVKRKGKALRNLGSSKGGNKKTANLPDTSRIPWFAPLPKTGTDA